MPMTNEPCAYCGRSDISRTKGHVIPRSLYPETLPETAQRITVPECMACKKTWEDQEPHFRNVMMAIWDPNKVIKDRRFNKMARSFSKGDGPRRLKELLERFVPLETPDGEREMIYPTRDPGCDVILRRIVRGLCYSHDLGFPISNEQVIVGPMIWKIPDQFEEELKWHQIGSNFFSYAYALLNEEGIHSFWLMVFSSHIKLFGVVTLEENLFDDLIESNE